MKGFYVSKTMTRRTGNMFVKNYAMAAGLMLALGSCQAASPPAAPAASAQPSTAAAAVQPAAPDASFTAWLDTARREALAKGVQPATVMAAFADLTPIPRVIELDNRQPEFSQTFTRYVNNSVTEARVTEGRALMQKHAALLAQLEQAYGLPGRFLVAFWGLETNYGRFTGDYPVVGALATLAYDGRRSAFFRGEMFNALTILDRGHIPLAKMKGSWAGAMGQTQFMPSTFLRHAVDQDGNGHIDIWGSIPDALGSGANYLKSLGWDGARTWGREVKLPAGFDAGLASLDVAATETVKPLREWSALGITRANGDPLPAQDIDAALALPAGANGPAFLLYGNYRAILKWNRSAFYAIAVGHLADRLIGARPLEGVAREGNPLSRDEVTALQSGLIALGFLDGAADGVMGSGTRQGVRRFQKASGLAPDGYPGRGLIAAVAAKAGQS